MQKSHFQSSTTQLYLASHPVYLAKCLASVGTQYRATSFTDCTYWLSSAPENHHAKEPFSRFNYTTVSGKPPCWLGKIWQWMAVQAHIYGYSPSIVQLYLSHCTGCDMKSRNISTKSHQNNYVFRHNILYKHAFTYSMYTCHDNGYGHSWIDRCWMFLPTLQ